MKRECGDCTACCRLVPVHDLGKPALQRCRFQRHGKGCTIYHQPAKGFPFACGAWTCQWLAGEDIGSRPDRAHFVVDMFPDYVTLAAPEEMTIMVIQIWADPAYPDAHRDPALRAWLERQDGYAAVVRYGNDKAIFLAPPRMNDKRVWFEKTTDLRAEHQHSFEQVLAAAASPSRVAGAPL